MAFGKSDGKVVIDTSLNNKGFIKGVKGLESQLGGLQTVAKKLGSVIASAFAVRAIVNFSKECIELGSNVAEVQNVVDVAFGDMTDQVEAFADTAIKNFGMSRLAAKKTASTYMAMAKGMGVPAETAADMSIALAGLTGDVASFYNISQELADTKLKSVFTGETETLKDLGVVMTQANLEAYALSRGITKSIDSMTQAEKVALRYNFVMDSLALANGDFARTSNGWANQTRILSMQWQEFMSIVGQTLITVLTPAVQVLNQVVSRLIAVASAINEVVSATLGTQQAVGGAISESVAEQDAMTDATNETAKAQKKLLAGFDEINKLGGDSGSGGGTTATVAPIPAVGNPASSAVTDTAQTVESSGLLYAIQQLTAAVEPFRLAFETAFRDIVAGAGWIKGALVQVWTDISSLASPLSGWFKEDVTPLVNQVVLSIGNTLGGLYESVGMIFSDLWNIVIFPSVQKWSIDILPALTDFASQFSYTFDVLLEEVKLTFERIWQEAIAPALARIQGIWEDAWDSILAFWEKWGEPIFEKVREAIQNTSDTLENIWENTISPVWDKFMETVDKLWREHIKPFVDNFLDFVGLLVSSALEIYNKFILPIINWVSEKLGPVISDWLGKGLEDIGDFVGFIVDRVNWVIDILKHLINFITGVFTGDWGKAWDGLKGIFKMLVNDMISMVENFVNFFVRAINRVIGSLNTLSVDVPDWVPLIGGNTFGFNIPRVSELRLPRLATGAVIPPNREFMAVLGDQNRGYNIEAPEDLIRKIVREESGGGMNTALLQAILAAIKEGKVLMVDRDKFAELVYNSNQAESRRVGVSLTGG